MLIRLSAWRTLAEGATDTSGGVPARRRAITPPPVAAAALWVVGPAARLAGRATILSPDKGPELLAEGWTCSPAALEQDGGWRAARDLATGLKDTAAWYATHGWL